MIRLDELHARTIPTDNGCLLWTGALFGGTGYGAIRVEGRLWSTHRLVWHLTYGPIPDGLHVCHTCDQRACTNPQHLFLGPPGVNTWDAQRKGRMAKKMTFDQVAEMRERYAAGGTSHLKLAAEYGVAKSLVHRILTRQAWRVAPIDHNRDRTNHDD